MNRWHGFLGVVAVWAALAGWAEADPAQHCKLEAVRLEPPRPGVRITPTYWLYRNVTPQRFIWQGDKGGDMTYTAMIDFSKDGLKAFKDLVTKEPKYLSKNPLRGVAKLGSKEYAFVLDQQSDKSRGYDRLYFDRNANGDLTEDKPIDAETPKGTSPAPVNMTYSAANFPRVDLAIDVDGKKADYSFFFQIGNYGDEKHRTAMGSLSAAVYRRGEITLDGKKRQIVLLDQNSNGRFDDLTSLQEDVRGAEGQLVVRHGDVLLVDPEKASPPMPIGLVAPMFQDENRQFLCKVNLLGGKYYELKVSPAGDELTCTPVTVSVGKIVSPHESCRVELAGDQGYFSLVLQKSRPVEIPAGRWRLLSYTITVKDWKDPAKKKTEKTDKNVKPKADANASLVEVLVQALTGTKPARPTATRQPQPSPYCMVSAQGTKGGDPIVVTAGETTTLKFGPPYKTRVKAAAAPGSGIAQLSLSLIGSDNEVVSGLIVNGAGPEKPKLTITDPKGKVVAKGDFEYG